MRLLNLSEYMITHQNLDKSVLLELSKDTIMGEGVSATMGVLGRFVLWYYMTQNEKWKTVMWAIKQNKRFCPCVYGDKDSPTGHVTYPPPVGSNGFNDATELLLELYRLGFTFSEYIINNNDVLYTLYNL